MLIKTPFDSSSIKCISVQWKPNSIITKSRDTLFPCLGGMPEIAVESIFDFLKVTCI